MIKEGFIPAESVSQVIQKIYFPHHFTILPFYLSCGGMAEHCNGAVLSLSVCVGCLNSGLLTTILEQHEDDTTARNPPSLLMQPLYSQEQGAYSGAHTLTSNISYLNKVHIPKAKLKNFTKLYFFFCAFTFRVGNPSQPPSKHIDLFMIIEHVQVGLCNVLYVFEQAYDMVTSCVCHS